MKRHSWRGGGFAFAVIESLVVIGPDTFIPPAISPPTVQRANIPRVLCRQKNYPPGQNLKVHFASEIRNSVKFLFDRWTIFRHFGERRGARPSDREGKISLRTTGSSRVVTCHACRHRSRYANRYGAIDGDERANPPRWLVPEIPELPLGPLGLRDEPTLFSKYSPNILFTGMCFLYPDNPLSTPRMRVRGERPSPHIFDRSPKANQSLTLSSDRSDYYRRRPVESREKRMRGIGRGKR